MVILQQFDFGTTYVEQNYEYNKVVMNVFINITSMA